MKCPKCDVEMDMEDDRCSTDRGTTGSVYYLCPLCDYIIDMDEKDED